MSVFPFYNSEASQHRFSRQLDATSICMGSALVCHDHRSVVVVTPSSISGGHLARVRRVSPDTISRSEDALLLRDCQSTTSSEFKECWLDSATQPPLVTEQNVQLVTGGYSIAFCLCTGLYASFLKGQGHQGIFSLVMGTL